MIRITVILQPFWSGEKSDTSSFASSELFMPSQSLAGGRALDRWELGSS